MGIIKSSGLSWPRVTHLQHMLLRVAHTMQPNCLVLIFPLCFFLLPCHPERHLILFGISTYVIVVLINSTTPKRSTYDTLTIPTAIFYGVFSSMFVTVQREV